MDAFSFTVALAALLAGLVAAYYTWRSFYLQRVSSSPAGLQFLLGHVRALDKPKKGLLDEAVHKPAGTLLGVYARGPGVRYNVTPIVWSKASTMEISDGRTTWAAEDGPLEAELWFLNAREKTHNTYFGIVWESPSPWTRKFIKHGYRMKLKWVDEAIKFDSFEVWSDFGKKWLLMPSVDEEKVDESHPMYESSSTGWDLHRQMEHRALDRRYEKPGQLSKRLEV